MRRVAACAAAALVAAGAGRPAPAQPLPPSARPSLTFTAGQALAGPLATPAGSLPLNTPGGMPASAFEAYTLRLDAQTRLALEGRWPVGPTRRWALVAAASRARGGATAVRRSGLDSFDGRLTTLEGTWRLDNVTSWRGTLGAERRLALPRGFVAAALAGATYGAVRSSGYFVCPTLPPSLGVQPRCAGEPELDLRTPGLALGLDLATPAWRGLRLRGRSGVDALLVNEAAVIQALRDPLDFDATIADGRLRWRSLPSFSLGLSVDVGG